MRRLWSPPPLRGVVVRACGAGGQGEYWPCIFSRLYLCGYICTRYVPPEVPCCADTYSVYLLPIQQHRAWGPQNCPDGVDCTGPYGTVDFIYSLLDVSDLVPCPSAPKPDKSHLEFLTPGLSSLLFIKS